MSTQLRSPEGRLSVAPATRRATLTLRPKAPAQIAADSVSAEYTLGASVVLTPVK
jgi:hypothetical protein